MMGFVAATNWRSVDGKLTGRVVGNIVDRPGKAKAAEDFAQQSRGADGADRGGRRRANDIDMLAAGRSWGGVQRQKPRCARWPTRRSAIPTWIPCVHPRRDAWRDRGRRRGRRTLRRVDIPDED